MAGLSGVFCSGSSGTGRFCHGLGDLGGPGPSAADSRAAPCARTSGGRGRSGVVEQTSGSAPLLLLRDRLAVLVAVATEHAGSVSRVGLPGADSAVQEEAVTATTRASGTRNMGVASPAGRLQQHRESLHGRELLAGRTYRGRLRNDSLPSIRPGWPWPARERRYQLPSSPARPITPLSRWAALRQLVLTDNWARSESPWSMASTMTWCSFTDREIWSKRVST